MKIIIFGLGKCKSHMKIGKKIMEIKVRIEFPLYLPCSSLTKGTLNSLKITELSPEHSAEHRRCLSYKVNLVLRKSQPSSETSI